MYTYSKKSNEKTWVFYRFRWRIFTSKIWNPNHCWSGICFSYRCSKTGQEIPSSSFSGLKTSYFTINLSCCSSTTLTSDVTTRAQTPDAFFSKMQIFKRWKGVLMSKNIKNNKRIMLSAQNTTRTDQKIKIENFVS